MCCTVLFLFSGYSSMLPTLLVHSVCVCRYFLIKFILFFYNVVNKVPWMLRFFLILFIATIAMKLFHQYISIFYTDSVFFCLFIPPYSIYHECMDVGIYVQHLCIICIHNLRHNGNVCSVCIANSFLCSHACCINLSIRVEFHIFFCIIFSPFIFTFMLLIFFSLFLLFNVLYSFWIYILKTQAI